MSENHSCEIKTRFHWLNCRSQEKGSLTLFIKSDDSHLSPSDLHKQFLEFVNFCPICGFKAKDKE